MLRSDSILTQNTADIVQLRLAVRKYMLHPVTLLVLTVHIMLRSLHLVVLDFPALGMWLDHALHLLKVGLFIGFSILFQPYVLRWFLARNVPFLITSYLFFVACNAVAFTVMHAVLLPDLEKVGGIYWFRLLRQSLLGLFLHFIVCIAIENQVRPLLGRDLRLVPFFRSVPKALRQSPAAVLLDGGLSGEIVAMNAQNQYVAVFRDGGAETELLRITLSAAIARLPADSGIQVHRSWWVSHRALLNAQFDRDTMQITCSEGPALRTIPVGKTFAPKLQAHFQYAP